MGPNGKQACCFAIFPFRFETRVFVVVFFVVAALFAPPQAGAQSTVPDIPSVEGPITGAGQMYPGLRPLGGIAQPYTTRMLVRQPKNPKRFSGIVLEADIPRRPHP